MYSLENDLSTDEFIQVLMSSGLAERRPIDNHARITGMLKNSQIIITARIKNVLVGVSRAITDYEFCCYLSDLAVVKEYQSQGIGKELIQKTHEEAGLKTNLFLVSSPSAKGYYPKIGMNEYPCWGIPSME